MSTSSAHPKPVWLDCDPGHDDAVALLLALHSPSSSSPSSPALDLLGVSTVAGNAPGHHTHLNAARLLVALGAKPDLPLFRGADEPLVRSRRSDPGIHGEDGLGGVECLPPRDSPQVKAFLRHSEPSALSLVTHLTTLLQSRISSRLPKLTLISTGPLTNLALLLKLSPPSLISSGVEQIVLMGGAAGVPGNRSPLAEFNILVDPEAASIVFDHDVKVVMAGLNVTHKAIFTPELHARLVGGVDRSPSYTISASTTAAATAAVETGESEESPIRRLLSTAMTFFASTYASEFGFRQGPPVHDMLAVAYVVDPTLFHRKPSASSKPDPKFRGASASEGEESASVEPERGLEPRRYHVRVECNDGMGLGATVVDFYEQLGRKREDVWNEEARNVVVLEELDCERLWNLFFSAVRRAESINAPGAAIAGSRA